VRAAETALSDAGLEVARPATSTDANAAHARGVPALALGVTTGSGEHTTEEWIDLSPLATGIRVLADTVDRYGRERA
jgi:acetylornithine deacetylase/succinyl-diaminopimelate desuccinylase-like protein